MAHFLQNVLILNTKNVDLSPKARAGSLMGDTGFGPVTR